MKRMIVTWTCLALTAVAAGQPLSPPTPWSGQRLHAQRAMRLIPDGAGGITTAGPWIALRDPTSGPRPRALVSPLWDSFEGCPRDPDGDPVGADVGEAGWNYPFPLTEGSCDAPNLGLGYRWSLGEAYNCPHIAVDLDQAVPNAQVSDGLFGLWYNPLNPAGLMVLVSMWDDMAPDQNSPLPGGGQLGGYLGGWLLDFGAGPEPASAWHVFAFEVPDGMPTPADGRGALELFACEHAADDGSGRLQITPLRTSAPNTPHVTQFMLWSTGENRTPQDLTRVGRSSSRQLNDYNPADGRFSDAENEPLAYGVNPDPLGAMVAIFGTQEQGCNADFNGDGFLDFFDYDDYVNCFETGLCPPGTSADFNGDGFADFFDYDDFVVTFESGC